jgi:hypothetical protein
MMKPHPYEPVAGQDDLNHDLAMNLVGPARGATLPPATSIPMMQIVAPATLPEGYEFEANMGEHYRVKVTVPSGGVEEGQTFSVPMPAAMETMITGISVPVGHWRDGFLDLLHYGICHPHVWTACCCVSSKCCREKYRNKRSMAWYGERTVVMLWQRHF